MYSYYPAMKVAPYAERRQGLRPLYFKAAEEVDYSSCWRALEYGWASSDAGGEGCLNPR